MLPTYAEKTRIRAWDGRIFEVVTNTIPGSIVKFKRRIRNSLTNVVVNVGGFTVVPLVVKGDMHMHSVTLRRIS